MPHFNWHFVWVLAIGYVLGYYFKTPGNLTVGKLKPAS